LACAVNGRVPKNGSKETLMNIEKLAKEAGFTLTQGSYWQNVRGTDANLQRFAELVADAEKERIATFVAVQRNDIPATGEEFAAAIRLA
jgi:hypothetical protein